MGLPIDLFTDTPDPNLLCPICQDVLDDPSSLQCGHLFCRSCLLSYTEIGSPPTKQQQNRNRYNFKGVSVVCPTCRHIAVIQESASTSHSIVKSIIENLEIKCMNQHRREEMMREKADGENSQGGCCDWKGKLCEYKSHAESACQLELVTCTAPDCTDRITRGCITKSGCCHKLDCVADGARDYLTAKTRVDFMLMRLKETRRGKDNGYDNGGDKENMGSKNNPALTGSSIAARGGSLLSQRAVRLCLEADKILAKPCITVNSKIEMASPSPDKSSPSQSRVAKRIHDNDLLMSPRPWATNNSSVTVNANKVLFEPPSLTKTKEFDAKAASKDKTDDRPKKYLSPNLDLIKNRGRFEENDNASNPAFVMAAVKLLVNQEMTKIQQKRIPEIPAAAIDGPFKGPTNESIQAMFVHQHLMDFCRSWIQRKPDALYDFVIYRPKIGQSSSSSNDINKLLCGIPGPRRTGWDGGMFPVLMEWSDINMPPKCMFPAEFHHANVKPSGLVSMTTLKDDWHPEITIPELLFDLQQLLAHPNHDNSAQLEARNSHMSGMYDYKTMIQTSLYIPTALLEMASGIDGCGAASSWQSVEGEALSSRFGVYENPVKSKPKEPTFVASQVNGGWNACKSYCSCCAWGQTLWDSKHEMRYLFGTGCS
ncbi:hypothetical protein ACHAXR_003732 [Thalassiosira sp. AJA248-18]